MTLDPAALEFSDESARSAFSQLLDAGEPLSAARIATYVHSGESRVAEVLAALKGVGRAELDGGGRLLGIYGLTLQPTEHRLLIRGKQFFVWCAFDSVGIPAALAESASVTSICAHCRRELSFRIDEGRPPSLPLVVSWLPQQCDSVREQFCPTVNFYCDTAHYRASLANGQPADAYITLEAAAAIGRDTWGWAAHTSDR